MKKFLIRGMYLGLLLLCLWTAGRAIVYYKSPPLQICDLDWPDPDDPNLEHKWRYYINPKTCLPVKIEKYQTTSDTNRPYTLTETLVIEYPTDEQMSQIIKKLSYDN